MQQKIQLMTEATDWQGRPGRRLAFSMLLAALLLTAALSLLRYPTAIDSPDLAELLVQIVESEPAAPEELPEFMPPEPPDPATESEPEPAPEPESGVQTTDIPAPATDWQALSEQKAKEVVATHSQTFSANPVFDKKRRVAAEQFRASRAPEKRYIWDNVEKDQIGRTLLWHGDCYRVLDDPSAVYRDIFETFTQYFVFCQNGSFAGKELPWVADVRDRHTYLQRQFDSRSGAISN